MRLFLAKVVLELVTLHCNGGLSRKVGYFTLLYTFYNSSAYFSNFIFTINKNFEECGERIYSDDGQISLYGYERNEVCQWHVSVNPEMHIEITVEPMKLASGDIRNCSVNSLEVNYHFSYYFINSSICWDLDSYRI